MERQLKSVPGVADITAFSGTRRVYEISVDPAVLAKYNMSSLEAYEAAQKSNLNVGGDVIGMNSQSNYHRILRSFPEVASVLSQTDRSNNGTDPTGIYYVQAQVNLKPKEEWKRHITKEQLIDEMNKKLKEHPSIVFNYSQPIIDNVEEAVAGINAALVVKIFGNDLKALDGKANEMMRVLATVPGVKDLGILATWASPK